MHLKKSRMKKRINFLKKKKKKKLSRYTYIKIITAHIKLIFHNRCETNTAIYL